MRFRKPPKLLQLSANISATHSLVPQEALPKRTIHFSLNIEGGPKGAPGNPMKVQDGVLTWVVDRGDIGNMHGQYDFFTANLGKDVEKLI